MRNLPLWTEYGALLLGVVVVACGSGAKESANGETGEPEAGSPAAQGPIDDAGGFQGPPGIFAPSVVEGGTVVNATGTGPAGGGSSADAGTSADAAGGAAPASGASGGGAGSGAASLDASVLDGSADDATASANIGGDATTVSSATVDANGLGVDSRAAYCAGSGPPVTVGDNVSGVPECTGAIAEITFSHALCTCQDTSVQGVLATDSFNSNVASYQPGQNGAPVGVNRDFITAGVPDIGGSLSVDGPNGVTLAGAAEVHGDFEVQGNLTLAGVSTVSRDLWVGGNLTTAGVIDVGRDLHEGGNSLTLGIVDVSGSQYSAPFTLAEPCACQPNEILDVDAIVAQGQMQNDDASLGLSPSAFDAVVGVVDVDLPCGRFYLDQIAGAGALTFHVSGRTALFVAGDIASAGVLNFDLDPAGELDVFVAGNLIPTGVASFGSVARPAAVRVYVGGSSTVALTGAGDFVGNIYAPNATVVLTGFSDIYGSVFADDFEAPGAVFIHYDSAVLQAGAECPSGPALPDDAGADDDASSASTSPFTVDAGNPPAVDSGTATPVVDASSPPPAVDGGAPPLGVDSGVAPPAADAGGPAPTVDAGRAGPSCNNTCGTCANATACVNGTCGSCRSDGDCCSPLVCTEGYCEQLNIP